MSDQRLALAALALVGIATGAQAAVGALRPPDEGAAEAVETQCSILGQEQGLTGKALSASVTSCVAQENPDLGVWETCRSRGRASGLKGDALQGFVTDCLNAAP